MQNCHNFVMTIYFFRARFSSSLKSLDLSYNALTEIPLAALARLKALDWLNLHRYGNTNICLVRHA
jgi:Ran GTPase-activating protein (RanGAP) involved in mRNA processing and transport